LVAKGSWLTRREEHRTSRTSDKVLADEAVGLLCGIISVVAEFIVGK
jgi:hypothetical protein